MKTKQNFNIFSYWRKHGFKAAMKQWKYNYVMLDTPEQIVKKEVIGYIGSIVGLVLALIFLTLRGSWYFIVVLGFGIYLASMSLKIKLRQLEQFKQIKKQFGGLEDGD